MAASKYARLCEIMGVLEVSQDSAMAAGTAGSMQDVENINRARRIGAGMLQELLNEDLEGSLMDGVEPMPQISMADVHRSVVVEQAEILAVMASEVGCVPVPDSDLIRLGSIADGLVAQVKKFVDARNHETAVRIAAQPGV